MPKRTDIKSVLIICACPLVICQACEFDYAGVHACKALRAEGYRVVLVNSNPATIMTDPEMADATYVEPIQWQVVAIMSLMASAVCGLLGPIFVPFFIVPKLEWLFWGWLKSFIQYSFIPVVAIAFLMIFEQFVFRYVTTLPPTITSAEYGVYALQAVAVIATFCVGIMMVPSLTNSIFSGTGGQSAFSGIAALSRGFRR